MALDKDLPWHVSPTPAVPLRLKKKKKKLPTAKRREKNAEKLAASARLEAARPFTVTLRRGHNINGRVYGPGTVTLPGNIARELSAREYHADRQEEVFRGERAAIIGGRTQQGTHRVSFVPPETFADSYGNAMPIERVSGAGLQDSGTGPKF